MRASFYIGLCLMLGLCLGCNKLPDPQFTFSTSVNFDIPPSLNTVETHYFTLPNTPTFIDLSLAQEGFTTDDITSIISQNAKFTEVDENINLDFINSIVVNAYTLDENVELFYLENIQFGNKEEIFLLASISELVEILNEDFVNFEVGIRFRQIPPSNFRADVELDFSVYAEQQ